MGASISFAAMCHLSLESCCNIKNAGFLYCSCVAHPYGKHFESWPFNNTSDQVVLFKQYKLTVQQVILSHDTVSLDPLLK